MFDISFSELMLCFIVALVVLGPDRLPGLARGVGRWAGKARGYMRNLTAELERETHIAEMKQQVQEAHRVLREQTDEVRINVEDNLKSVRQEMPNLSKEIPTLSDSERRANLFKSEPEHPPVTKDSHGV